MIQARNQRTTNTNAYQSQVIMLIRETSLVSFVQGEGMTMANQ